MSIFYDKKLKSVSDYTEDTGEGTLKIFVFAGNEALPVDKATVIIKTDAADKNAKILYKLYSNSDGETNEVKLKAPLKNHSLTPYDQAYFLYYIDIEHPDYNFVKDCSVQIFSDITTVLPINLQPKNEVI